MKSIIYSASIVGLFVLGVFSFALVPIAFVVAIPAAVLLFFSYGIVERYRAGAWPPVFQAMFKTWVPKIVVVEDDSDIVLLLRTVFRKLGYSIAWISGSDPEAGRRLAEHKADFVLLDWRLGGIKTGRDVMSAALEYIEGNRRLRRSYQGHQMKVVTFSAAREREINLPLSEYCSYRTHWRKNLLFNDLTKIATALVEV